MPLRRAGTVANAGIGRGLARYDAAKRFSKKLKEWLRKAHIALKMTEPLKKLIREAASYLGEDDRIHHRSRSANGARTV
jgi:hypothetical protein